MRWSLTPIPKEGDTRIVKKFLLLPKCINNEYRWLETATYKEEYRAGSDGGVWITHWTRKAWLDPKGFTSRTR